MTAIALHYRQLHGAAIDGELDAIAALRIRVFREWPYLYEGSLDYERRYLSVYSQCPDSLAILVYAGDALVAVSTALPLGAAEAEMQAPFLAAGLACEDYLYFGESLVLRDYRGQGIGGEFFTRRENHARALGLPRCCFCAVQRAAEDPRQPADYRGNEVFWQRRGYQLSELYCEYPWPDIGESRDSNKTLRFWRRDLVD